MARRSSRLLNRRFLRFFILLAILALLPPLLFHLKLRHGEQIQARKCSWIKHPPFVCAHGGDSSIAPPNTMIAYKLAISSQVGCIEIDASRSRDGVLVALHDRDLQNITGYSSVKVGDVSIGQIRRFDAGSGYPVKFKNQEVPSLENALKFVMNSVSQIIIDAKVGPPWFLEDLARDLMVVINRTKCNNCLVWAKVDSLVRELKKLSPELMVGYIVMKDPVTGIPNSLLRMQEAEIIGIYHALVDKKVIRSAHSAGKKVYAWTVDDYDSMERMLFEGVDGIITSNPHMLQQVMEDLRKHCAEMDFT